MKNNEFPDFMLALTRLNLDKILQDEVSIQQLYFSHKQTKRFAPMIHGKMMGLGVDDVEFALLVMNFTEERKYSAINDLGKLVYQKTAKPSMPLYICFISEVWHKEFRVGEIPDKPPAEYEDREESIGITVQTFGKKCKSLHIPIIRDEEANIILGKPTSPNDSESPLVQEFFFGFMDEWRKEHPVISNPH